MTRSTRFIRRTVRRAAVCTLLATAASVGGPSPTTTMAANRPSVAVPEQAPARVELSPAISSIQPQIVRALVTTVVPNMYADHQRCSRTSRRCRYLGYWQTNGNYNASVPSVYIGWVTYWTWSWNP
jgi:hypothetical protein